jgi:hypothetical protein
VTLLDEAAPNAEAVTVAWLTPLGAVSIVRKATDPLPFRLVTRVAGADDSYELDRAVVSEDITLPGGVANVTFCETFQSPIWVDYGDEQIERYVARYRLGLSFVVV